MLLFRTSCSTDNKGNPHHILFFVGKYDNIAAAQAAMNEDIRSWMIDDIIEDEEDSEHHDDWTPEDLRKWRMQRLSSWTLTLGDEILKLWKSDERREVRTEGPWRQFKMGPSCEWTTIVYHVKPDDFC